MRQQVGMTPAVKAVVDDAQKVRAAGKAIVAVTVATDSGYGVCADLSDVLSAMVADEWAIVSVTSVDVRGFATPSVLVTFKSY